MKETAWHALIAELTAETATDQVLRELRRVINENHRNTFAGLLASNGLVDTAQEASTTAHAVHHVITDSRHPTHPDTAIHTFTHRRPMARCSPSDQRQKVECAALVKPAARTAMREQTAKHVTLHA